MTIYIVAYILKKGTEQKRSADDRLRFEVLTRSHLGDS